MITGTSSTATPFIASAAAVMTTTTESVFAFMLLTGLMSGLVTYLCGVFNLSRFLHFFPLPVTKGFFAAIGVSMIIGGCNMSASLKLTTLASWYKLTDMTTLLQLASCIAFGLACKLVKSKSKYVWGFPVFVLLVLGLFFAILFASQGDLDSARQSGWLFATPTESTSFYSFWTMLNPVKVDWSTWTTAAPIALITLFFFLPIDLILSLAALEVSSTSFHLREPCS
jgi:MFS superfamily sulfate permease-like transporter